MGLVIIEKYNENHFIWKNIINKKSNINLEINDILTKYNGFEGIFILVKDFENQYNENLGEISEFNTYLDYFKKNNNHMSFLYLNYEYNHIPTIIKDNFTIVGFEFGYCKNEFIVYSSIFNEIIFGTIQELINYKDYLNDNLLFSTKDICLSYKELHNHLSKGKVGVEEDKDMKIYEIWKYRK